MTIKRGRFTETQIVSIPKEPDSGGKVKDICRHHGISDATYYNWKSNYGGVHASDLKRLKKMEAGLSQYKKMYAELACENYALKDLIEKSSEVTGEARSSMLSAGRTQVEQNPCLRGNTDVPIEQVSATAITGTTRSRGHGRIE
jgi:putative transposase